MSYNESQLDKKNRTWFNNHLGLNTLKKLSVSGRIRGVKDVSINFDYPITALVGENGSGKSTLLALAACAFHNKSEFCPESLIPHKRKKDREKDCKKYYTYKDFFVFSSKETELLDVQIKSECLSTSGIVQDTRKKKPSGKWNDYDGRPKRVVSYLGVNRIVPPSESSPHRSYQRNFKSNTTLTKPEIDKITSYASKILGRTYKDVDILQHQSYSLFKATRNSLAYTGFNMGAGENAVFNLLVEITKAGKGALIVVDELELGLHAQAQKNLIKNLNEICLANNCQIICSSHSKEILESLPLDARKFIIRSDKETTIISGISADYAFGKLSNTNSGELDVFVEDDAAQSFMETVLPVAIKDRIHVKSIGSADSILDQMAACYRAKRKNFISFLDGDKESHNESNLGKVKSALKTAYHKGDNEDSFMEMMRNRLNYLPGPKWPEAQIIATIKEKGELDTFVEQWGCSREDVDDALEKALLASTHSEFFTISQNIHTPIEIIKLDIFRAYKQICPEEIECISRKISDMLATL